MQYFVGNLIEGETAKYYEEITSDLEQKFGIKNLSKRTPPHFTFKAPFQSEDISDLEEQITKLTSELKPIPIHINGFEVFNAEGRTIFLHADEEKSLMKMVEKIVVSIEGYGEDRKPILKPYKLHLSVARFLTPELSIKIRSYLQTLPKPQYSIQFDNITLFKHFNGVWNADKIFRF
jgi:2'-5' RNA ligase